MGKIFRKFDYLITSERRLKRRRLLAKYNLKAGSNIEVEGVYLEITRISNDYYIFHEEQRFDPLDVLE